MEVHSPITAFEDFGNRQLLPSGCNAPPESFSAPADAPRLNDEQTGGTEELPVQNAVVQQVPEDYFDDFQEDLSDPQCVQRIYDFSLRQVRGMVDYNDEDDVIQEVFYRLHKWPIGNKYNSARHYFSLLKITIRQAIAAYWKRRHSQRNDARKRVFISQLQQDGQRTVEFVSKSNEVWRRLHLKDLVRRVMERASTLPNQQQKMFQLRFLEEKSHEEIAEVLGVSIRTSYRIETKIREILQSHFKGLDLDRFRV